MKINAIDFPREVQSTTQSFAQEWFFKWVAGASCTSLTSQAADAIVVKQGLPGDLDSRGILRLNGSFGGGWGAGGVGSVMPIRRGV